ncbi:unnamed protein product [Acanthoscelides obtectus]|uniref:Uncharacterized protein n=1 Tax=Acanthoscelides obtectus TaxID=200917 RepID=A0A9P0KK83_ACAOB|nr:unnamed protein product [Acanthoscelides obtectus]CAK1685064.1 hypothetical protein AOBTE_LOCUS35217 [Acanthoscelides obtectus]
MPLRLWLHLNNRVVESVGPTCFPDRVLLLGFAKYIELIFDPNVIYHLHPVNHVKSSSDSDVDSISHVAHKSTAFPRRKGTWKPRVQITWNRCQKMTSILSDISPTNSTDFPPRIGP